MSSHTIDLIFMTFGAIWLLASVTGVTYAFLSLFRAFERSMK